MTILHRHHYDDLTTLPEEANKEENVLVLVTGPVDFEKFESMKSQLLPHVQWRLSKESKDLAIIRAKFNYHIPLTDEDKEEIIRVYQIAEEKVSA